MRTFQIIDHANTFNSTDKLTDRDEATRQLAVRIGDGDPEAIDAEGASASERAEQIIGSAEASGEPATIGDLQVIVADEAPRALTYRERRERRARRRREWGEGRTANADAAHQAAHDATRGIPFGQPILVGHHSERRHRNAIERANRKASQAVEHSQMARRHTEAADTIERQLDASIYDDDHDAIEQLRARIEEREAKRERIKQYNRNRRKGSRDLEPLNDEEKKELADTAQVAAYQLGPKGEAPRYWLTNLGGSINRDKKRLARLEAAAGTPTESGGEAA